MGVAEILTQPAKKEKFQGDIKQKRKKKTVKKIRRTRITVKIREILIVKNGINVFDGNEQNVCPLCHSPIIEKSLPKPDSAARLLEEEKPKF